MSSDENTTAKAPGTLYVQLRNRHGDYMRVFAPDIETARRFALEANFVKRLDNAKVFSAQVVCPRCFPHHGVAVLLASEDPAVYAAGWGAEGRQRQLSGKLHNSWGCRA